MIQALGLTTLLLPLAVFGLAWAARGRLHAPARTARYWGAAAAALGALGVAGGAYLAHGAAAVLSPDGMKIASIASEYHLIHSIALAVAAIVAGTDPGRPEPAIAAAAWCFAFGIAFFCGALYLVAAQVGAVSGLAPFGGTLLIVGWIAFAIALWRRLG